MDTWDLLVLISVFPIQAGVLSPSNACHSDVRCKLEAPHPPTEHCDPQVKNHCCRASDHRKTQKHYDSFTSKMTVMK